MYTDCCNDNIRSLANELMSVNIVHRWILLPSINIVFTYVKDFILIDLNL